MGDEIVMEVKEDEWLVGRHALQVVNRMFQPDVWLVGTDYLTFDAEARQPARTDRKDGHWVFRKELFFTIDENDLANGQYEHS
jgi:chloramphenicol 3-O-phosphotransferase